MPGALLAGGINTNRALTPPKGGSTFRLQYSYVEADGHGRVRRINRRWLDADLSYQFKTGTGQNRHDLLGYNLSYSYRLFPKVYESADVHELDAVAELNGRYSTSGSHVAFLSPGLQSITERWIFETSLQLPIVQELDSGEPETEYRLVMGFRFQW